MNKLLLAICIAIFSTPLSAQNSLPNGNFENWINSSFEFPIGYLNNSNFQAFYRFGTASNLIKSTDAHHGASAAQLTTTATANDTNVGYFVNTIYTNGPNWHGGIPISQSPTGVRGYYKCNILPGDSGLIVLSFSNAGTNIGMYFFKVGGIKTNYTLFDFNINPPLAMTPDSMVIGFTSSDFTSGTGTGVPGSMLLVDSINIKGLSGQPAGLNGSFENWQTQNVTKPASWYAESDMGQGYAKTTDVAGGNFAIELITTLGDNMGVPAARSGRVSTGWYDNNCSCQKGGQPFTNQIDTLIFSYKYVPTNPNDTAEVMMSFKNSGAFMGWTNHRMLPSPNYQLVKVPINLFSTPDSVIVEVNSSIWNHQALNYVGASLKIDEMHFKSQPLTTGIKFINKTDGLGIFPNPAKDYLMLQTTEKIKAVSGINQLGQTIEMSLENNNSINVSALSEGVYLLQILTQDNQLITRKFIKIK